MRALALLLVPLLAGCAAPAEPASGPTPASGSGWSVVDTSGTTWTEEGLRGRPALLFFMATWCGSCQATAPKLARLHEEFGDAVQFLSIDFDPTETKAEIESWKEARAQPWPHALDPQREAQRAYGITIQSTVVVLGAEGEPVWKSGYGPREEDVRAALETAIA